MKNFYFIIIAFFCANLAFSQNFNLEPVKTSPAQAPTIFDGKTVTVQYDLSKISLPANNKYPKETLLGTKDTLNQYFKRSSGFATYGVTINSTSYPLTGWNPYYLALGQKFNTATEATVTEILVGVSQKIILGASADSIIAVIFSGFTTDGLPENFLGGTGIPFSRIDTNYREVVFTAFSFDPPVTVNGNFVPMVQTYTGSNEYDAVVIWSSMQGNGLNENKACLIFNNQGILTSADFGVYWGAAGLTIEGHPPNFDIMIIPILDRGSTDIDDPVSLDGFTLKSISPLPVVDRVIMNIEIARETDMNIRLVDISGKVVYSIEQNNLDAGGHSIDLDLSSLPTGSYYYVITTNYTKFGGKLNIVR